MVLASLCCMSLCLVLLFQLTHGLLCPATDTAVNISGPSTWRGKCLVGEKQSPVDLVGANDPNRPRAPGFKELKFKYSSKVEQAEVINTGHGTMQVGLASLDLYCPLFSKYVMGTNAANRSMVPFGTYRC